MSKQFSRKRLRGKICPTGAVQSVKKSSTMWWMAVGRGRAQSAGRNLTSCSVGRRGGAVSEPGGWAFHPGADSPVPTHPSASLAPSCSAFLTHSVLGSGQPLQQPPLCLHSWHEEEARSVPCGFRKRKQDSSLALGVFLRHAWTEVYCDCFRTALSVRRLRGSAPKEA